MSIQVIIQFQLTAGSSAGRCLAIHLVYEASSINLNHYHNYNRSEFGACRAAVGTRTDDGFGAKYEACFLSAQ